MKHAPQVEARQPKILLIDIETAPILGFSWGLYQTDVFHVLEPTYILSFAYQWMGRPKVHTKALCDYPGYKTNDSASIDIFALLASYKQNKAAERKLVSDLWDLLDEAEIVIAHNGDRFDIPKINSRMLVNGHKPPTPHKTIDTLKIARRYFKFDSNKLDNIGGYLGIGRKLAHTGKHLWLGCMCGNAKAWRKMKQYNGHDVRLLLSFYDQVKAWDKNHPILTAFAPRVKTSCPVCLSDDVHRRGWNIAKFRKTPRFQCRPCGHWFSGTGHLPKPEKDNKKAA